MSDKKIKVTLAVSRTGPSGPQNIGDEIEVTVAEASRMIAAGQLAPVDGAAKKELAKLEKAEYESRSKAEQEAKDRAAKDAAISAEVAGAKAYIAKADAAPDGVDPEQLAKAIAFVAEHDAGAK